MKISAVLPVLIVSLGIVFAQPAPAPKPGTPANAAAAKPGTKKEEPPGKIEGVEIPRGAGFLGLRVVGGAFRLTCYDAKKKPAAADFTRAAVRWDAKHKVGDERAVLNPTGDGQSFGSPKPVRPPYNFKVFLTLITEGADGQTAATETFTVDFRQ
jgi:hypothetical protein